MADLRKDQAPSQDPLPFDDPAYTEAIRRSTQQIEDVVSGDQARKAKLGSRALSRADFVLGQTPETVLPQPANPYGRSSAGLRAENDKLKRGGR